MHSKTTITALAAALAGSLFAAPASAQIIDMTDYGLPGSTKTVTLPTPVEAYRYIDQVDEQSKWFDEFTAEDGAFKGDHIHFNRTSKDEFGSKWWGGAYRFNHQLWNWENDTNIIRVSGMSLTADAKLVGTQKQVAYFHLGGHNLSGDVVNGKVQIMEKTVRAWHRDGSFSETYTKTTDFFDEELEVDILIFSLGIDMDAQGLVKVDPRMTVDATGISVKATPLARATASGGFSAGIPFLASAGIEGTLDPLVEVQAPATSSARFFFNKPCWTIDLALKLKKPYGEIKVWGKYLGGDKHEKTIADFGGGTKEFELVNEKMGCPVMPDKIEYPF